MEVSKQIVIIKKGSLSPKEKEKLTKAGNTVIEHNNPSEVIFKPMPLVQGYEFSNCCECGERIYINVEKLAALKKSGKPFYCLFGHSQAYTKKINF